MHTKTYIQVIRIPLSFLPLVIASSADALVALGRISEYLTAEELVEPYTIQESSDYAVDIEGDFVWETAYDPKTNAPKAKKHAQKQKEKDEKAEKKKKEILPTTADHENEKDEDKKESSEDQPFELKNLSFKVPKGAFVAIVGTVGSGKVRPFESCTSPACVILIGCAFQSSLLQALIGEMRRTRGRVRFYADYSDCLP